VRHLARPEQRLGAEPIPTRDSGENRVLYLPAPISLLHFLLRRGDARFQERRLFWSRRPMPWSDGIEQITPLTLLPLLNRFPFSSRHLVSWSLRATVPPLASALGGAGFLRPDVLIITNLQYATLDRIVRPRSLVYRCVDDIRGFARAPRSLTRAEVDLLKRCDFCFATSSSLAEKLKARGAKRVHIVRHGVDFARFADASSLAEPADLARIPRPRIIYVGTLSEWFNAEWVSAAARSLPGYHFVLVGPRETGDAPMPAGPNVHLLGPRQPDSVPAYLHACDAAMIPFRVSPLVESVLPVKLYEFLAAGLPVVAARWRELEQVGAPIVLAGNAEDFAEAVRRAPGSPGRDERIAFARANSWERQFETMIAIIRGTEDSPR
jgi:glycosyltransferase involved in cell wall biosynthesis